MKTKKIRTMSVACLAATAGLATAATLVLSAPATGVGNGCAKAAPGSTGSGLAAPLGTPAPPAGNCEGQTTATTAPPPNHDPGCEKFVSDACGGSVTSGDSTAIHGSVASGCSTAVDKSTASGGNCAPARKKAAAVPSSPAQAVHANPHFAG